MKSTGKDGHVLLLLATFERALQDYVLACKGKVEQGCEGSPRDVKKEVREFIRKGKDGEYISEIYSWIVDLYPFFEETELDPVKGLRWKEKKNERRTSN